MVKVPQSVTAPRSSADNTRLLVLYLTAPGQRCNSALVQVESISLVVSTLLQKVVGRSSADHRLACSWTGIEL